ncbi:MAG: hemerythrin domain-containing protein [Anaerolineales bacterium]|nr:hemerythrin domain-containing protein [Anaerolineales bacterium]
MNTQNPAALEAEHNELHVRLERTIQMGGEVGAAAARVAEILHAHFVGEERYGVPPLALLPALAAGRIEREMAEIVTLTETLKAELPQMLAEHQAVAAALGDLAAAAKRANSAEVIAFTEQLKLHMQNEEEVLYPAAILVGEYLKLKLGVPAE